MARSLVRVNAYPQAEMATRPRVQVFHAHAASFAKCSECGAESSAGWQRELGQSLNRVYPELPSAEPLPLGL